jgi:broad specificity phosphatase PhoE
MRMAKRIATNPRLTALIISALLLWQSWLPAHALERTNRPPLEIWFVRHAESELNVASLPRSAPDDGVSYPLTRRGMEQALALADAHADTPIVAIYTSTRLRAIQTADALAFKHRLPITLAPEAAEIDLGLPPDAPNLHSVYEDLRTNWLIERNIEARHGAGESLADVQRRFLPFVREVMNRHAHDSGVVIIMSHSATLGFLVPMLAANVPADFALRHPLTNTGIIKTRLVDNSLVCTDWLELTSEHFQPAEP